MRLIYRLSFIFTGVMMSAALFTNISRATFIGLALFLAACLYQCIYMCKLGRGNAKSTLQQYALHIAITYEVVSVLNLTGLLGNNPVFFIIGGFLVGDVALDLRSLNNPSLWLRTALLLALCIAYQAYYYNKIFDKKERYTPEQLAQKVGRMRKLMALQEQAKERKAKKANVSHCAQILGTEIFLETEKGTVRALAYNLDKPETLPLYINMHGGGFVLGSAEMDDPFMQSLAENTGVKILSVDYSLAPEYPFPKALHECYAVAKYAKLHPEIFGIDPGRIAVGGQSAGGNLAAAICLLDAQLAKTESDTIKLKCAVLDYPPLDIYTDAAEKPHPKGAIPVTMSRMFDACYCYEHVERGNPLISPIFAEPKYLEAFPPTLIIAAIRDSLLEEAKVFKNMLAAAGVEVTYKQFDAAHGFNLNPGPEADESWQLIANHLKRYLYMV